MTKNNVGGQSEDFLMTNFRVPTTPAAAWRSLSAEEKAFKVGVISRVIWEITKPVLLWSMFILLVGAWAIFSVIWKVLSGSK